MGRPRDGVLERSKANMTSSSHMRASIATEQGDYAEAIADLERAADLARAVGDTQLEATARTQRAMVIQLRLHQQSTPSSQTRG
jgi:hypothetical protein